MKNVKNKKTLVFSLKHFDDDALFLSGLLFFRNLFDALRERPNDFIFVFKKVISLYKNT